MHYIQYVHGHYVCWDFHTEMGWNGHHGGHCGRGLIYRKVGEGSTSLCSVLGNLHKTLTPGILGSNGSPSSKWLTTPRQNLWHQQVIGAMCEIGPSAGGGGMSGYLWTGNISDGCDSHFGTIGQQDLKIRSMLVDLASLNLVPDGCASGVLIYGTSVKLATVHIRIIPGRYT